MEDIELLENEYFIPIKGYENDYLISNYGRFYRKDRYINNRWGKQVLKKGQLMKPSFENTIYLETSTILKKGLKIDYLLLEHFEISEIKFKLDIIENLNGEIWLPVKEYEGLYEVSNKGRIKVLERQTNVRYGTSIRKEKLIKPSLNKVVNYLYIGLHKNGKYTNSRIHRLVAEAFIPNPENKKEVNHINGDKLNNSVENLEWNTPLENTRNAFKNGHNSKRIKLNFKKIKEIKELSEKGMKNSEIAKIYGVQRKSIWRVVTNQAWNF